jgi:hypothetical protein
MNKVFQGFKGLVVTARVSQRYGCENSLFGGERLLLFIVGQQNMQQIRQQISKSDSKSVESVATVR